jgi:DNA repair protein RadC
MKQDDSADLVFVAPTSKLTSLHRPNRKGYKYKTAAALDVGEAVDPYGKYQKLLVRTALVRHEDYVKARCPIVSGPRSAAEVLQYLTQLDQEFFITMATSNTSKLLAIHETSVGTMASTAVAARDVLKVALLTGATGIIVAHNHPSGNVNPSAEDRAMAAALEEACKCVGVTLLDSLVISYNGWRSMLNDEGGSWT